MCRPFEDEQHTSNGRCLLPPSFCVARLIAAESPARRAFTGKRITFARNKEIVIFSPSVSRSHPGEESLLRVFGLLNYLFSTVLLLLPNLRHGNTVRSYPWIKCKRRRLCKD